VINGINDELILAARLLLTALFLIFGWRKLRDFSGTVNQMVQLGVPMPALAADTEALLVRSAIEALAMAAKAGQVVSGFSKVEGVLALRQAKALIHASDGAADGIRKLDAIARQKTGNGDESREIPLATALTSEQLDLALGRSNVIHAAVLAGPASKTFLSRSHVLVRYRMADDDKTEGHVAKNTVENSPIQTVRTRTTQQD